jgi:hypothetical protein
MELVRKRRGDAKPGAGAGGASGSGEGGAAQALYGESAEEEQEAWEEMYHLNGRRRALHLCSWRCLCWAGSSAGPLPSTAEPAVLQRCCAAWRCFWLALWLLWHSLQAKCRWQTAYRVQDNVIIVS